MISSLNTHVWPNISAGSLLPDPDQQDSLDALYSQRLRILNIILNYWGEAGTSKAFQDNLGKGPKPLSQIIEAVDQTIQQRVDSLPVKASSTAGDFKWCHSHKSHFFIYGAFAFYSLICDDRESYDTALQRWVLATDNLASPQPPDLKTNILECVKDLFVFLHQKHQYLKAEEASLFDANQFLELIAEKWCDIFNRIKNNSVLIHALSHAHDPGDILHATLYRTGKESTLGRKVHDLWQNLNNRAPTSSPTGPEQGLS
jgi:hypothetical protein